MTENFPLIKDNKLQIQAEQKHTQVHTHTHTHAEKDRESTHTLREMITKLPKIKIKERILKVGRNKGNITNRATKNDSRHVVKTM